MDERIDYLKEAAKKWPGASVYYREDWDCDYFEIEKKGFCMLGQK